MMTREMTREELNVMPFDKRFDVDGSDELCHATGYEVFYLGEWWNEYVDSNGDIHLGR